MSGMRASDAVLAIDTATSRVVLGLGSPDGRVTATVSWPAGHRHGETLLPAIEGLLQEHAVRRSALGGLVVGTGPGAFTGLRVGMATAKGLALGLGVPLVGVSTAAALLGASGLERPVLLVPAGPADRIVVRPDGSPRLLPGGSEPDLDPAETLVAVDLDGRAPAAAVALGEAARDGLAAALLRLAGPRLATAGDDPRGELDTLVPEYVTLPRGARSGTGVVTWSRDPR